METIVQIGVAHAIDHVYNIIKSDYTEPAVNNPSMNILLTEIADNPQRKEAAPAFNPIVEAKINEKTKKFWDQLKNIGEIYPKVLPENIVLISLRDFEKEEKSLIDKYGIKVITTNEVRRNGAESVSKKVLRYLSDCSDIYISFDVDSLDSSISKGTGTPVSNGLKEREAEDLISKFMQSRKICCFEITEVNPTLDKENLMAEIAFNILKRSVNVLMMN